MLVIFSGSSGAGKNTIISALLDGESDKYVFMPTVTTRAMRTGEREGMPYHFTTEEDFLSRVKQGEFVEYENVHGNFYGTSRRVLNSLSGSGKTLLKDIDVLGTLNLAERLKDEIKIVTIFITVDAEVLRERLIKRGDRREDIEVRLSRFMVEQAYAPKYNYIVKNDDLAKAIAEVKAIIEKESRQ